jgi:hypothetical protein
MKSKKQGGSTSCFWCTCLALIAHALTLTHSETTAGTATKTTFLSASPLDKMPRVKRQWAGAAVRPSRHPLPSSSEGQSRRRMEPRRRLTRRRRRTEKLEKLEASKSPEETTGTEKEDQDWGRRRSNISSRAFSSPSLSSGSSGRREQWRTWGRWGWAEEGGGNQVEEGGDGRGGSVSWSTSCRRRSSRCFRRLDAA